MRKPELLPCPFCGGTPWISEDDLGNPRWVSCDICECDGPSWLGWMDDAADVTRQGLIAAWNQRQPTPLTLTPDQVERAKTIVSQCDYYAGTMTKLTAFESLMGDLLRELVGE